MAKLPGFLRSGRTRPTETVGVGGTIIQSGYVIAKEKQPELASTERFTHFSEIAVNVGIVGAGMRYFLNLVAKVTWKPTPPEDSGAEGERLAELVESIMYDMDTAWSRVIRRIALYRFTGFSLSEWTAKRRDDGVIGWDRIEPRPCQTIERWDIDDETGEIYGVVQRSPTNGREIYLPRNKLVYLVDDSISDSPEGIGIFRHMYPLAKRLQRYEELEAIGFETDLRGIPLIRAPLSVLDQMVKNGEMSSEQKQEMVNELKKWAQAHVRSEKSAVLLDSAPYRSADDAATPSSTRKWDAEIMTSNSSAFTGIDSAITRQIYDLARLIGVEHLLLGDKAVGSFALSRDKTQSFFLIVDSTVNEIGEALERDLLRPLWKMNGWDPVLMPSMKPEPVRFRDVEQIAGVLRDVATAGAPISLDDPAINDLRDLMGLSRVDLDAMATAVNASLNRNTPPNDEEMPDDEEEDEEEGVPSDAGSRDE